MLRLVLGTDDTRQLPGPKRKSVGFGVWHVWTVTIPRRSITGRLVWGTVLRRRDDDRWIYKKYIEHSD